MTLFNETLRLKLVWAQYGGAHLHSQLSGRGCKELLSSRLALTLSQKIKTPWNLLSRGVNSSR